MQVGDLVKFPCDYGESLGIVLRLNKEHYQHRFERVQVYWFVDSEASWEPKKWMEVINASR